MDEMRQVPVGGTSRDFTAVLDLSPTAMRDAAGVRLASTSSAESKYIVDGMSMAGTRQVPEGYVPGEVRRLEKSMQYATPGPRRGERVEVHARAKLRSIRGVEGAQGEVLRQGLSAGMERLSMCFENAPRATYRVRRGVTLRVVFAANGKIHSLRIAGSGTGDPALQQCLRDRLTPLLAGTTSKQLTLELRVAMQF
jgi:Ca-activated chloride channel family protein